MYLFFEISHLQQQKLPQVILCKKYSFFIRLKQKKTVLHFEKDVNILTFIQMESVRGKE